MKLVILDRDGVINQETYEYIKTPDEWIPIPGSLEAIAQLKQQGFTIVIATNQSGIARGLYSHEMLNAIHYKMHQLAQQHGGAIDAVFYCPHLPDEKCDCRKPKPGLLHQIADHFKINLEQVPFIGDSLRDLQAAQAVNALPILVKTGNGMLTQPQLDAYSNILCFDDLWQASQYLIQSHHADC